MKGKFIVFEGIDGCGKGTVMKSLHNNLLEFDKRFRILTTREPTYNQHGLQLRNMLKTEKDPLASAEKFLELHTKDRKEHLDKIIIPFLEGSTGEDKNIVLCDRYYYSTIAYQGAQGIEIDKILEHNKEFLVPDAIFIFDLPSEEALKRVSNADGRDGFEKFEKDEFIEKVRQIYLDTPNLLPNQKIFVIDATKSKEEVFKEVLNILKKENFL